MNFSKPLTRLSGLVIISLLVGAWGVLPARLQAAEQSEAQQLF
jgi:hypothetical protein